MVGFPNFALITPIKFKQSVLLFTVCLLHWCQSFNFVSHFYAKTPKTYLYHQRIDNLVPVIFLNITVQKGEVRFFRKPLFYSARTLAALE